MLMSVIVILLVALIAYLWSSQGAFSAFLHLLCVIIAGAIAFAFWETIVYTFLLGLHEEMAWGLGLLLPFLISLVALRLACDKLIPANLDFDDTTNFIGGLVFGAVAGVLAIGVLVIAIGFFRVPSNIMGYKPVDYDAQGNLVRKNSLILPVDRVTLGFYEFLSRGALSTERPLAVMMPDAHEQATLVRFTPGDKGRTSLKPDDFAVLGRYKLETSDVRELLTDSFTRGAEGNEFPQQARDLDGESYPPGSRIEGFLIQFNSGARERNGRFVASPGHFRLIGARDDGSAVALHPVAVISQGVAWSLDIHRWRYDASEIFFESVGGGSTMVMGFEFVVPPGVKPSHLIVRNVRSPIPSGFNFEFTSVRDRDAAIRNRSLFESVGVALTATGEAPQGVAAPQQQRESIRRTNRLPGILNRSARGQLVLDNDNQVIDGQHTFPRSALGQQGLASNLRVEVFANGPDTWIVQVDVGPQSRTSLLGRAVDAAERVLPPLLVDNLGQRYEALGFIHESGTDVTVRFTPGRPIRALSELPQLSRSRPNEKLTLLFRVNARVTIEQFTLGNQVIEDKIGMTMPDPPRR